MLQEERLGGKDLIQPKVALEMMQLIAGSKAFHLEILKMKFSVQEVISFDSPQNLDFKHSLDAKMSLKQEENKKFKD